MNIKYHRGIKMLLQKKDKGNKAIYGDLIIWKEIINYASAEKKPIIFVTDDRKEDWWRIENGETIGPREELIQEFFELTANRILIYNPEFFLKYAKERGLVKDIKQDSINEVEEMRKADADTIFLQHFTNSNDNFPSPYALSNYEINPFSLINDFYKINQNSISPVASSFADTEAFKVSKEMSNTIGSAVAGLINTPMYKLARQWENSITSPLGATLAIPDNYTAAASEILNKKDK